MININRHKIIVAVIGLVCFSSIWSSSFASALEEKDSIAERPSTQMASDANDGWRVPRFTPDGEWNRLFRLKTNSLGWVLLISNVMGEIDLSPRWSLGLEIDYSGIDYFTPTVKFRIFGVRPGIRYWFAPSQSSWYVGAHLGMAYWNFAFGGEYRYQDDWRRTPALGGGVSFGYRMPISKDGRWEMEFGVGIGVYRANHNRFVNEKNGKLVDTVKKMYFGPDFVGLSFSYVFDAYNKQKRIDRKRLQEIEENLKISTSKKGGVTN